MAANETGEVVAMTPRRQDVLDWAAAQLGHPNEAEYWSSALGSPQVVPIKLAWCGIFTLAALHAAGLALDTHWRYGSGYVSWLLRRTSDPKPGDIGYRDQPWQHHFIVEALEPDRVHSIDGNSGAHSTVNRCTHANGTGCVYYSIAPLVGESVLPSPSKPPVPESDNAAAQHAVNNLIMTHVGQQDAWLGNLLVVDGIIGPRSKAALEWAQRILSLPITGAVDLAMRRALGLA